MPIRSTRRRFSYRVLEVLVATFLMLVPVAFVLLVLKVTLWPL